MKKLAFILFILLCLTACENTSEQVMTTPSETLSITTESPIATPVLPTAHPTETPTPSLEPITRESYVYYPDANYIFIQNALVGCYAEGRWISIADTQFSIAGLLEQERYYCYSPTELLGISEKVKLYWDEEGGNPGSFYYENDGNCLIPYAVEYNEPSDLTNRTSWNMYEEFHKIWVDLPCKLPENLRYITIMDYNTPIDFISEHESWHNKLVMSYSHNPFPEYIKEVELPYAAKDIVAVADELIRLGIPGAIPNITAVYECDLKGDGNVQRIIFANSKNADEYGYLVTDEEIASDDSGVYYLVLVTDGTNYDTLISRCEPYSLDDNFQDTLIETSWGYLYWGYCFAGTASYYGIFDLNNDGAYEICTNISYLDNDDTFVFALDDADKWGIVLQGRCGLP